MSGPRLRNGIDAALRFVYKVGILTSDYCDVRRNIWDKKLVQSDNAWDFYAK